MYKMLSTNPVMILGYQLNFDMIAFFVCILVSLILLLVLLIGAAGKRKRESRYIAKANANTARIPVRTDSSLQTHPSGRRGSSSVKSDTPVSTVTPDTPVVRQAQSRPAQPRPVQSSPAQPRPRSEYDERQTPPPRPNPIPVADPSMPGAPKKVNEGFCPLCSEPAKGRFCAKCGFKLKD